jgi:hypothetical protein
LELLAGNSLLCQKNGMTEGEFFLLLLEHSVWFLYDICFPVGVLATATLSDICKDGWPKIIKANDK